MRFTRQLIYWLLATMTGVSLTVSLVISASTDNKVTSRYFEDLPDDIWVSYDTKILEGIDLDQYYNIINNLRCPVCQGQSIAESDSQISIDLKSMVYQKISEGLNENEIKKLLTDKYGYYINFDPPVNQSTIPLWFFPFLIAIFGVLFVMYRSRTHRKFEKWK